MGITQRGNQHPFSKDEITREDRIARLGTWVWRRDSQEVGLMGYTAGRDAVTVFAGDTHQLLPVLRTACNYGGSRCWLGCPACGRRVAILYWRSEQGFGCRGCHQVAYSTQAIGWLDRAMPRQVKVERRLGEGCSRPRAMHRRTYERLLTSLEENERLVAGVVAGLNLSSFSRSERACSS